MTEYRVLAAARGHAANQVDQLVGAVAEAQFLGRDAVMRGQRPAQVVSSRVRVAMKRKCGTRHSLDGFRRGPVRVLVRRELHDVIDAELALQLVFGFAWLVRRQRENVGCGEVAHGARSAGSGIASEDLGITCDAAQLLHCGQDGPVGDVAVHFEEEDVPPLGAGRGPRFDAREVDLAVG